jgi:hypothetical protein
VSVLFRRIRGRAAGHVVTVNPLLVMSIEPTSWGGSELNFSDVYAVVSRDNPHTVQQLLEGRVRLCSTPLCDHDTDDIYQPVCQRCRAKSPIVGNIAATRGNNQHGVDEEYEAAVADLVVVGGRHGFA